MTHNIRLSDIKKQCSLYKKEWSILAGMVSVFIIIAVIYLHITTNYFYYIDKDLQIIYKEKRFIPILLSEKKIQFLLQSYLSGSVYYKGKIPFSQSSILKSCSYDKHMRVLILNWNTLFYKEITNDTSQMDMKVFLKTIKLNTEVQTIYFLIEGKQVSIVFDSKELYNGLNVNNIK